MDKFAAPLGRLLLSAIFIQAGIQKLQNTAGTAKYMASKGLPGWMVWLVIALEVLGGLCVLLGLKARVAALLLAGFTIVAAVIFHMDFGDRNQAIHFMKNLAIAGGFLMIVAYGPGPLSMDGRKR